MPPATKVVVRLTADQRRALEELVHTGECSAHAARRARILLKADADGPDARTDERIAGALDVCRMTVMRARQRFAAEGLAGTLRKRKAADRQYRSLGGAQEARLVAIACSEPPAGHARWTAAGWWGWRRGGRRSTSRGSSGACSTRCTRRRRGWCWWRTT